MEKYDALKLEKQLCFPLYAVSKEIVKKYKPFLDELDLTYTQYITMMVMWEHKEMNVKELGEHLYLDSGTLTPVLKKLEQKGWVKRNRAKEDERVLIVTLTAEGEKLRDKAVEIPQKVGGCVCLDQEEAASLYKILYKIFYVYWEGGLTRGTCQTLFGPLSPDAADRLPAAAAPHRSALRCRCHRRRYSSRAPRI